MQLLVVYCHVTINVCNLAIYANEDAVCMYNKYILVLQTDRALKPVLQFDRSYCSLSNTNNSSIPLFHPSSLTRCKT